MSSDSRGAQARLHPADKAALARGKSGRRRSIALQGISLGVAAAVAGSAVRAAALSPPATTTSASVSDRECKPPRRLPQKQRNEYGLAFLHGKGAANCH